MVILMPLHHTSKSTIEALEEDIDAIVLADKLGFSEAWVGEHYSSAIEQITSPLMFHANLINRTKNIKFATGVMCLHTISSSCTGGAGCYVRSSF